MKKIFSLAMAAAFAFGLASCSKDVNYGNGGGDEGDLVATFTLQTPKGAFMTYADQIAEGDEWKINSIDVYAFDKSTGTMINGTGRLYEGRDYEVTSAPGAATTTIKVLNYWLSQHLGKEVYFYFIANDREGANGAVDAPHIDASNTSIADFEKQVTKPLGVVGDKTNEVIRTPLLFSAKSEAITLQGRQNAKVTLTRREARFDIVNAYAAESNPLVINEIQISNAPRSGKIFADGGSNTVSYSSIWHGLIHNPAYAPLSNGKYGDYVQETNAKGETVYRAKSAFYLYPTVLGEGAAHTQIVIKATMNGVTNYYSRATKDAQGVAIPAPEILANHRYTLVLNPLSLTFEVVTSDYEEGGEIETDAGGDDTFGSFVISGAATSDAAWNASTQTYKFVGGEPNKLTVTVDSKFGTTYEIQTLIGDESKIYQYFITKAEPVFTYGRNVRDVYTMYVYPTSETEGTYLVNIVIKSPNGKAKEVITLMRGTPTAGELAPYMKDPVVANEVADQLAGGKSLDEITSLNFVGVGKNPSSLTGLEILRGLEMINYSAPVDGPKLTEIDLTGCPKLTQISLSGANISKLDLSNNPALTFFQMIRPNNLMEIEVSNKPELTSFSIYEAENLTKAVVANNPKLESFTMNSTKIAEIDLSSNTALKSLSMFTAPITKIDISGCKQLNYFGLATTNNPTIYVWSDFDTANPVNTIANLSLGSGDSEVTPTWVKK